MGSTKQLAAPQVADLPDLRGKFGRKLYTWYQRCDEIHVTMTMPSKISKAAVKVAFKPRTLHVAVCDETLLKGTLEASVDIDCCTWCLAKEGTELQVMLTKTDGNSRRNGRMP